jgi:prepilin-type N-terminal cleavage/methylation domain-containing protein
MPRRHRDHRPRAFTLVELLAVTSITALLMSMLLPSLKSARENAKRVKCQANLRQINTALYEYIIDGNALPLFWVTDDRGYIRGWCEWKYGGWIGINTDWDDVSDGVFRIPANKRPLTVYMNKGRVAPPKRKNGTLWEEVGQPVFECPSDRTCQHIKYYSPYPEPGLQFSSYEDVGTSYYINFDWWYQTDLPTGPDWDGDGRREPTPGIAPAELTNQGQRANWPARFRQGVDIWKRQMGSSRFVTLMEEPFDEAVYAGTQEMGAHGRFSRHVLAFFDGHVAYLATDTRNKFGPEWTVVDERFEAP